MPVTLSDDQVAEVLHAAGPRAPSVKRAMGIPNPDVPPPPDPVPSNMRTTYPKPKTEPEGVTDDGEHS